MFDKGIITWFYKSIWSYAKDTIKLEISCLTSKFSDYVKGGYQGVQCNLETYKNQPFFSAANFHTVCQILEIFCCKFNNVF